MEKTCRFLGIKSDSFTDKEGEKITYARLHVWDEKICQTSIYPFPNKEVELTTAEFGDHVNVTLVESVKKDYKTGAETNILKAISCVEVTD